MKPRVCAVSYLNTAPLVWGLLHGPQQGVFDLRFELPSRCADLLRNGEADIGLVPSIELERQPLEVCEGSGISSAGPVRSILLISKDPPARIAALAADISSRTSVVLSQILLRERYGALPKILPLPPDLPRMLDQADAALIIGDPALALNGQIHGLNILDLGEEWTGWTELPMVYAVWAARAGFDARESTAALRASWEYGRERIGEIADFEGARRRIAPEVARSYLTHNIQFDLDAKSQQGLQLFRSLARRHGLV